MIIYPRFGTTAGNLGNQLFQLAALTAMSKEFNCEYRVPTWKYSSYFINPPSQSDVIPTGEFLVTEGSFSYTPQWWSQYANQFREKNISIFGWLQSYKYFDKHTDEIKKLFSFKSEFIKHVMTKVSDEKIYHRPIIAISIRRGDYVGNPNYELLPIRYYIGALMDNFPNFRNEFNLMIFSDDIQYCKVHFQCLKNAFFADGMSDIEQLCFGAMFCEHTIAANSTFSYWIAMLQQFNSPTHKVIRPVDIFKGKMKENNDIGDHYPPEWTVYNHNTSKINLKDVTFTVPVFFDSNDRRENVELSIAHLIDNFDTNIIIGEQGAKKFEKTFENNPMVKYHHFDGMTDFHRTKMLNDMSRMCETTAFVNFDADVFIPPMQIIEAAMAIRDGKTMVYPYDGRFARVQPRQQWAATLRKFADVGMFRDTQFRGMGSGPYSVGGAIMFNTDKFIEGGMENEHMISYAPEDTERYERFNRLGYSIDRISGVLYHLDHAITENSSISHVYYQRNVKELGKIQKMSNEELKTYVKSWPWAHQYRPSYYESIHEEAVASRDEVFKVLIGSKFLFINNKIIDVGCGTGSWGSDIEKMNMGLSYKGIDFGVPQDKLNIPVDRYMDFDIRNPIDHNDKYDLVLCLEVAEHIEEKYADQLIKTLTKLGDLVLFSAAIPGQGGMQHVNEQWQSYWMEKFADNNFSAYFPINPILWDNDKVSVWYRQNMILYAKSNLKFSPVSIDKVHPKMWTNRLKSLGVL